MWRLSPMRKPAKIAITIRSFNREGPAYTKLQKYCDITYVNSSGIRLSGPDLIEAISGCTGVIAGTEKFSSSVLDRTPELRLISRVGVGTDSIDLGAARAHGIQVVTTPNSPVQAVAEHTLALLLAVTKHIPQYNEQMHKNDHTIVPGTLVQGKKAGIIGIGRVGTRVAEILENLGCQISYFDPFCTHVVPSSWKKVSSIEDLIAESDILSIHSAPLPEGKPLITGETLSRARSLIIINTARGTLLDEQALIEALSQGRVKAAGLDVFPDEPYSGDLLKYPQVITTPHVASNTSESRASMEMEAAENLIRFFQEVPK